MQQYRKKGERPGIAKTGWGNVQGEDVQGKCHTSDAAITATLMLSIAAGHTRDLCLTGQ